MAPIQVCFIMNVYTRMSFVHKMREGTSNAGQQMGERTSQYATQWDFI